MKHTKKNTEFGLGRVASPSRHGTTFAAALLLTLASFAAVGEETKTVTIPAACPAEDNPGATNAATNPPASRLPRDSRKTSHGSF